MKRGPEIREHGPGGAHFETQSVQLGKGSLGETWRPSSPVPLYGCCHSVGELDMVFCEVAEDRRHHFGERPVVHRADVPVLEIEEVGGRTEPQFASCDDVPIRKKCEIGLSDSWKLRAYILTCEVGQSFEDPDVTASEDGISYGDQGTKATEHACLL